MRTRTVTALLVAASLTAAGTVLGAPASASDGSFSRMQDVAPEETAPTALPDEQADHVLVEFAPTMTERQQRTAVDEVQGTLEGEVPGTGLVEVALGAGDPAQVADRLKDVPGVVSAQVDHVRRASVRPDDELIESALWALAPVRLPRAWDESIGDGVVVAVLGTGVEASHDDLDGGVLPGIDLVDDDADPADPTGTGTFLAGVVAGTADNRVGGAGVAPGAMILPVRVVDRSGTSTDSDVAAGIAWAVGHGADVITLPMNGPQPSPVLLSAVQQAVGAGTLVVASAGDGGLDVPMYPAAYAPQVAGLLSVTATDETGRLALFGPRGDTISLAAPGKGIYGPWLDDTYTAVDAPMAAAAVVSGVAALVLERGDLDPATLERRLETTANDAGHRGVDPFYGFGVVDAAAAVTAGDDDPAAVAVPLGPIPSDGATDDTRATARTLPAEGVQATLSPDADVDWFRFDAPARGWYRVTAAVGHRYWNSEPLDPVVEVRDAAGDVLARAAQAGWWGDETVVVAAAAPGPLFVRVSDARDVATRNPYRLTVSATTVSRFEMMPPISQSSAVNAIEVGDVTGDGVPDVVSDSWVWPGTGFGDVATPVSLRPAGMSGFGPGFDLADLDGDGDTDVVVANGDSHRILRQQAGSLVAGATMPSTPQHAGDVTAADLDGDDDVDLVLQDTSGAGSATIWRNNGAGVFTAVPTTIGAPGPLEVGDVTGDGRPDLVTGRTMLAQKADGTFGAAVPLPPSSSTNLPDVALGDVTGDGRLDVVRSDGSGVRVDPQLPGGGVGTGSRYETGGASGSVAVGDMDRDGRLDVLVADSDASRVWILPQRADGTLGPGEAVAGPWSNGMWDSLQVADLDGDGWSDAAMGWIYGVTTLKQNRLDRDAPVTTGWVKDVVPHQDASGVAVRPTVQVTFEKPLDAGSVTDATVRLLDGATAEPVTAVRSYDAATRTITLKPSADLSPGRHYQLVVSGVRDADGHPSTEHVRSWFTVAAGGARFTPVDPVRVLDSRTGWGLQEPHRIASGQPVVLDLRSYLELGATAVVLNVTAAAPSTFGNIRVFPHDAGGEPPRVSNINVAPGIDQPNLVTVKLGDSGFVTLLPEATSTDLIADVSGYYSPAGAAAYEPVAPARLLDTRSGVGAPKGSLVGGSAVDLRVSGIGAVPADAVAVVLNVTATQVAQATHVRVFPTPADSEDQTPPDISNLNLTPGRDQPNLVTVRVGDAGRVRLYLHQGRADLIADIAGYYSATGDHGFVPVAPTRIADTRSGQGIATTLRRGTVANLKVAGVGPVPAGAAAVVLNVTGVQPRGITHVRAFPATTAAPPDISTINLVPGRDEANLALVPIGLGGAVSFYPATADVDVVVDVGGYFTR